MEWLNNFLNMGFGQLVLTVIVIGLVSLFMPSPFSGILYTLNILLILNFIFTTLTGYKWNVGSN